MACGKELKKIRFRSIEEFGPYRPSLMKICEEGCGTVEGLALFIALNEGVNNALLHGRWDIPDGAVDLAVRAEGGRLCVHIRSGGGGLPLPSLPDHPLPDVQESGRGLHIIRSLVDHLSIEETGSHVTLRLEKRCGGEILNEEI